MDVRKGVYCFPVATGREQSLYTNYYIIKSKFVFLLAYSFVPIIAAHTLTCRFVKVTMFSFCCKCFIEVEFLRLKFVLLLNCIYYSESCFLYSIRRRKLRSTCIATSVNKVNQFFQLIIVLIVISNVLSSRALLFLINVTVLLSHQGERNLAAKGLFDFSMKSLTLTVQKNTAISQL